MYGELLFLAFDFLSFLHGHSVFSSPPQRPMTFDFERFFYPIFYPLYLFSYLNSWERASIFPSECSVLNKDTTGTIFITSLVLRGPWLGIEPGTCRTRSQHYTTWLSKKRLWRAISKEKCLPWQKTFRVKNISRLFHLKLHLCSFTRHHAFLQYPMIQQPLLKWEHIPKVNLWAGWKDHVCEECSNICDWFLARSARIVHDSRMSKLPEAENARESMHVAKLMLRTSF